MEQSSPTGQELAGQQILVLGATGNVGFFLVDALLAAGAEVLAVGRSRSRFDRLAERIAEDRLDRIAFVSGDISTVAGARELQTAVRERTSSLAGVVASSAGWHQTPTMLGAGFDDFRAIIETRLFPHYLAAEALLPLLNPGGSYVFINGPVAFLSPVPQGAGAITVAAAGQSGLMRAIAGETTGSAQVNEVVMHAFLGPQGTRRGSQLAGEDVGGYVAALIAAGERAPHGRTLQLENHDQVARALTGVFD